MKQTALAPIITLEGVKYIRLVLVCAWCPKETQKKLQVQEEYTHGICDEHLRQVTKEHKAKRQHVLSV